MKLIYNKRKIVEFFILVVIFILAIIFTIKINASTKLDRIDAFPDSYKPYLEELKKKYPNWEFTALYTNLDWNYVVNNENVFGKNLIPKNYSDSWKNTTPGQYNVEVDGGWVDTSRQAVEYCMDPRNFLNEVRIFQFQTLSYDKYTTDLNVIEKVLYGTEFYNKKVDYLDSLGNTIHTNDTYSQLILKAGQTSSVNPYYLASRIKQEVGPFLTHNSISGNVEGYKGLYNFYNIGSSYINVGQNTVYLQKFDVNNDRSNSLFWHQYMTNVLAPYSESKSIYNGYKKMGILDTPIHFIIPVYNNMPQIPTQSPDINNNEFDNDNTKMYCKGTNVNVRTGPGTSYEILTTVSISDTMTRIKKGKQSSDKWDKVILDNGIIGYIYQIYLEESPKYEIEIHFDAPLTVNGLEISGINYNENTVKSLKQKITTNSELVFVNNKGVVLKDEDEIGTGSKIQVKENGKLLREYNIIIYGDINGDGKINTIDLLVLQRHILEIERIEDIYTKAGNINKNGNNPNTIDLLLIQRHILGLQIIKQ